MFGDNALTVALLDRLTHHAHVIPFVGESYRFKESKQSFKYQDYGDELEDNYMKQLEKLLEKKEHEIFWPVIKLMLQKKIRLEQEALLVADEKNPFANAEGCG